ncbi:DNA ligase [Luteibacter phage vB_LflM-Pluto]|uniref:DNA ligase n=1 Tax=Luteibacter phage vB_LflM-Pluto TaxID=2948611 RepID=A0A9E7MTU4_9CAUD|nr:DNA ligase [Luteibacter phage vB_LflM-Pluto]
MIFRSPMLAKDYDPAKLAFPLLGSPKIDGIRCVVDRDDAGLPVAYSRSGKPIRNAFVQKHLAREEYVGLDGELVVGPFNAPDVYNVTSSGIMSSDGEPDFTFHVFDFRADGSYTERTAGLLGIISTANRLYPAHRLRLLTQAPILGPEELEAFEADCLENGFEGIMIRRANAPYKYGRSSTKDGALLKVKRFKYDEEATIVDVEELMHNENEAFTNELGRTKRSTAKEGRVGSGMVGAFICSSPNYTDTFRVSAGSLSHKEKERLWNERDGLRGLIIRFKHLPHGAKDRPRHGLFEGFRHLDDLS